MDEDIPERPKRKALLSSAPAARADGEEIDIRVRNLSGTGLGGVASTQLVRDESIAVEIRGIGEVRGHVAWTRGVSFGMVFDEAVDASRFAVAESFLPTPEHYTVNRRFRPVAQTEFRRPGFKRA